MSPPFRWVRPEVYPLIGAFGLGLSMAAYIMYHQLTHNTEVTLNRELRQQHEIDKVMDEKKFKAHNSAPWRRVSEGHRTSIFGNDVSRHDHEDQLAKH
ncbi:hypothetical protein WJX72_002218 [[Myrmecia] bisecta]|uniref:NADH dehydrogenase [ubiquinone] 1 alpha subcomplex subunit 13 n=1 Tax=[Myrmecia] bisecta TaxID=41462 RepID=A0AAW1Q3K2_9CHLO